MIVSGSVSRLRATETASQNSPHCFARPGRIGQKMTGTHFIQVANAHNRPPSRGPVNWAAHSIKVSCRLMLPVSRLAPNGKARTATMTAVVSGRRRYAQWIVQSRSRIGPDPPDEPRDIPWQHGPRREERQHPWGVDVGQERPDGMVGVAAVQPDTDSRPVRASIGTAGLPAGDHAGQHDGERQAEQQDRGDPTRIVESRDLAPKCPAEDAGTPSCSAIHVIGEVDDDPSAAAAVPGTGWSPGGGTESVIPPHSRMPGPRRALGRASDPGQ